MGNKGPKAIPNALKGIIGRTVKGVSTARKGHGTKAPTKRYKK